LIYASVRLPALEVKHLDRYPCYDGRRRRGVNLSRRASEAARELAASRPKVDGKCAVCGKPFVGLRTRKYCSRECAWAVFRERHRNRRNAWQREYYRRRKQLREGTGSAWPALESRRARSWRGPAYCGTECGGVSWI
jgi:hypothetical protein